MGDERFVAAQIIASNICHRSTDAWIPVEDQEPGAIYDWVDIPTETMGQCWSAVPALGVKGQHPIGDDIVILEYTP